MFKTETVKPIVGTITVGADYTVRHTGETACNYNEYVIHAGEYPVEAHWNNGKRVLVARMKSSLVESYYVNRVFSATSINHNFFEVGEKETEEQWRWGDHSNYHSPFDSSRDIKLKINVGWTVTAEYRGNYDDGRPMIAYGIEQEKTYWISSEGDLYDLEIDGDVSAFENDPDLERISKSRYTYLIEA